MMRKKSLFALMLVVMMVLSGCTLPQKIDPNDGAQAIIEVGGETITKEAFTNYANSYADSYALNTIASNSTLSQWYQLVGGNMSQFNEYYKNYLSDSGKSLYDEIYESMANGLAQNLALKKVAADKGLDQLTEEELAEVKEAAEEQYNAFLDTVGQQHVLDTSLEGDALREKAKELAAQYPATSGIDLSPISTLEGFVKMLTDQKAISKLLSSAVSDEEVQTALNDVNYRMIKHILILYGDAGSVSAAQTALDAAQEAADAAQTALDSAAEGADLEALKTALEEANTALETAKANLTLAEEKKAKAEEVYAKATAEGADFDALMSEYSEDTGLASYPDGYPVSSDTTEYVQQFTDAAMALANVGDISEIVETTYGYHILCYDADATSDSDAMNAVRENKRNELLQEPLEAWINEAQAKTYLDRLN